MFPEMVLQAAHSTKQKKIIFEIHLLSIKIEKSTASEILHQFCMMCKFDLFI